MSTTSLLSSACSLWHNKSRVTELPSTCYATVLLVRAIDLICSNVNLTLRKQDKQTEKQKRKQNSIEKEEQTYFSSN